MVEWNGHLHSMHWCLLLMALNVAMHSMHVGTSSTVSPLSSSAAVYVNILCV